MNQLLNDNELENVSGGAAVNLDHLIIRIDLCTKCNVCADYCVKKAIAVNANGVYVINQNSCDKCGTCIGVCPVGAIRSQAIN